MADKLEPSESLMPKIRALIAPPPTEEPRGKGKKLSDKDPDAVPWKTNHDHCDFCGEGGDLLCCDKCPWAFHLACCEPPVDPDNIPSGDWLCAKCRPGPVPCPNVMAPFDALVKQCLRRNPTAFSLPPDYSFNTPLPGGRKKKKVGEGSKSTSTGVLIVPPSATAGNAPVISAPSLLDNDPDYCEGDRSVRDFCFVCNRTKRVGPIVFCDFCPLVFHLDCLSPPLTNTPGTLWMCPNHAEHHVPSFRQPLLSERCAAIESTSQLLSRKTVVLDFLHATRREASPEPASSQLTYPKRKAIEVPSAIKSLYRQPLVNSEQCTLSQLCSAAVESKAALSNRRRTASLSQDTSSNTDGQSPAPTSSAGKSAASEWWKASKVAEQEQRELLDRVLESEYGNRQASAATHNDKSNSASMSVSNVVTPTSVSSSSSDFSSAAPSAMEIEENTCQLSISPSTEGTSSTLPSPSASSPTPPFARSTASSGKDSSSDGPHLTEDVSAGRHHVCGASLSKDGASPSASPSPSHPSDQHPTADAPNDPFACGSTFWPRRARKEHTGTAGDFLQIMQAMGPATSRTEQSQAEAQRKKAFCNDHLGYSLPNVERLDSRLIQLLAAQRLQQIMSGQRGQSQERPQRQEPVATVVPAENGISNASPVVPCAESVVVTAAAAAAPVASTANSEHTVVTNKHSGTTSSTTTTTTEQTTDSDSISKEKLLSAKALLCPVSSIGSPYAVSHDCVNIGLGDDMDLCLRSYSPCLRLSYKHASLFYDQNQQQYEFLSYSEYGVYVDGVLYGCDVSHLPPTPTSDIVSMDHVRSSIGKGARTRRAQQRVQSARRRWRQPHSMRYLQGILSYCGGASSGSGSGSGGGGSGQENDTDCAVTVNMDVGGVDSGMRDMRDNSDTDDEVAASLTGTKVSTNSTVRDHSNQGSTSPGTLLLPGLLSRPPRSPSPSSNCLTPMEHFSSWVQRQEAAIRSAGFWLPGEAENCLPTCSCAIDNSGSSISGCVPGTWEGSAILHHGSTIQLGCLRFVFSVAGKPGHDQLVQSLLGLAPSPVPLPAENPTTDQQPSAVATSVGTACSSVIGATSTVTPSAPTLTVPSLTTVFPDISAC